jgi:TRAP transporter 4TM/12TM fusion protein
MFKRSIRVIVLPVALLLSLFQLYTGGFGVLTPVLQRGIHLTLVLILIFLLYPISNSWRWRWLDYFAICLTLANGIYLYREYLDFVARVGIPDLGDKIFAGVTIILILEGTRRVVGWVLPGIACFFLAYIFYGYLFPGIFQISHFSYDRMISLEYMSTSGIWGITLGVAASFVALFILFGGFLETTGAGKVFIDLAFAIGGRFRGGPAKVAVLASGMMGTVSGSAVANVSTVGTFTIPLMKKVGYLPRVAAGIESVASTGGQIMPPVMGAGAFIMARYTGIPYADIVGAAFIPAIMYYISVFLFVDLEAGRLKLKGVKRNALPEIKTVFLQGINLYVGLGALIYLLVVERVSPMLAAFWAIIALIAATIIFKFKSVKWTFILEALEIGAQKMLLVTVCCATAGIIVGVIRLTGIGITLTTLFVNIGQDSLLITLLISMLVCIILGMGMPPAASYILLGVLVAPGLVKIGLPLISAHMFVYYLTSLAPITPPVALAAYAAAGIAGSNPTSTGLVAVRIGLVAFIIPFMFVYGPSLLAQGSIEAIITTFISASIGVFFLVSAICGWFTRNMTLLERILALGVGGLLIKPGMFTDMLGVGVAIFLALLMFLKNRKLEPKL